MEEIVWEGKESDVIGEGSRRGSVAARGVKSGTASP